MSMHGAPMVGRWTGSSTLLSPTERVAWALEDVSDTKHSSCLHVREPVGDGGGMDKNADRTAISQLSHSAVPHGPGGTTQHSVPAEAGPGHGPPRKGRAAETTTAASRRPSWMQLVTALTWRSACGTCPRDRRYP